MCTEDSGEPACDKKSVTDEQKQAIAGQLEEMKPLVKNVYFESEQQAFDRFQKQFRNSPLAGNVRVGDIPQNFRVQLSDPTKYDVIVSSFEGAPGVGAVQDQKKVLDKFFKGINYITIFSFVLASLMVLCAVLLMATTIRQAAFSRRRETGIMKLVGASNFTIRFPFMMETLISALLGAGAATALLWATANYGFNKYLNQPHPRPGLHRGLGRLGHHPVDGGGGCRAVHRHLVGDALALPAGLRTAGKWHPIPRKTWGLCYQ